MCVCVCARVCACVCASTCVGVCIYLCAHALVRCMLRRRTVREPASGIRRSHHSARSPPAAAARHISSCRCGSSEPTRGEDVLGVSSVPAQMWPGAAGDHEALSLLQAQAARSCKCRPSRPRKPFVAKAAQARELDLPHETSTTGSFPACGTRSLSVVRMIGVVVGPATSSSCAARTGRPKSAPPSAHLHTRSVGRTYVQSVVARVCTCGSQTFVSPQTQLLPGNAGCSSNRCEGWLPFLTHPMRVIELASALQSRHLCPESPGWNSTVQRLLGLAIGAPP